MNLELPCSNAQTLVTSRERRALLAGNFGLVAITTTSVMAALSGGNTNSEFVSGTSSRLLKDVSGNTLEDLS